MVDEKLIDNLRVEAIEESNTNVEAALKEREAISQTGGANLTAEEKKSPPRPYRVSVG